MLSGKFSKIKIVSFLFFCYKMIKAIIHLILLTPLINMRPTLYNCFYKFKHQIDKGYIKGGEFPHSLCLESTLSATLDIKFHFINTYYSFVRVWIFNCCYSGMYLISYIISGHCLYRKLLRIDIKHENKEHNLYLIYITSDAAGSSASPNADHKLKIQFS